MCRIRRLCVKSRKVEGVLVQEHCFAYWNNVLYTLIRGPGSSVGIVTELRAGRSGDRIPVGRDFPPVQTGPPSLLYNGYRGFPGGKIRLGRGADNHPLLVSRSWKSRAIPLPTLWATTGPVTGTVCLYTLILHAQFQQTAFIRWHVIKHDSPW